MHQAAAAPVGVTHLDGCLDVEAGEDLPGYCCATVQLCL